MKLNFHVRVGLALMAAITLLFWFTDLDLKIPAFVYSKSQPHWPYNDVQPWGWLYHYGQAPGNILGLGALALWIFSFFSPRGLAWRRPCLFIFLLYALGPGLIINGITKPLMGRPRPDQVLEFGGTYQFVRPFGIGVPFKGYSFISGHCSMAFVFIAFFFLLEGWKRWLSLALTLLFGLLMGIARVCQGAHFPSDVLLCGALLYTLAAVLDSLVLQPATKAA